MLVLSASNWNVKTYVLDKDDHCPASNSCTFFYKGDQLSFDDVYTFGQLVDVLTLELENVNIDALKKLKQEGKRIYPDPDKLEIIQDKGLQKQFYEKIKVPSSSFLLFNSKQEIISAFESGTLTIPFVQKLRKGGYDGRGVSIIRSKDDLINLLEGASVVEELNNIDKEISAIVARNERGEVRCHPTVEMEFNPTARNGRSLRNTGQAHLLHPIDPGRAHRGDLSQDRRRDPGLCDDPDSSVHRLPTDA